MQRQSLGASSTHSTYVNSGPYANVTGMQANGQPALARRPSPPGNTNGYHGTYSDATYGRWHESSSSSVSGGYDPATYGMLAGASAYPPATTNPYAPATAPEQSATSPRYGNSRYGVEMPGPGTAASSVYDLTADYKPSADGGGGGGGGHALPYDGSVYGMAAPPSRESSMHTYSELAQPAHMQEQYEYTFQQGQPAGTYEYTAPTPMAPGRAQHASASGASAFSYQIPSDRQQQQPLPPPAGGNPGSQSAYLDHVTQLIMDGEECKKVGNFKRVAERYREAANVMMDMVEQQRWPPGEERRKAISTARRYIEHSKSYETLGPGFAD